MSLVMGYGVDDDVSTPEEAVTAALALTRGRESDGTHWFVYDRQTGRMHLLEQKDFDPEWQEFR